MIEISGAPLGIILGAIAAGAWSVLCYVIGYYKGRRSR